MSSLYLLDPEPIGPEWTPFAGARPVAELRAGAWRIRERWEQAAGFPTTATFAAHATGFVDVEAATVRALEPVHGPAVVASSTFVPLSVSSQPAPQARRLVHRGRSVAWLVPAGESWDGPNEDGPGHEIDGIHLRGTYDLLTALEQLLEHDCAAMRDAYGSDVPAAALVLGPPTDVVCREATVEPGVVFDVRHGPVVVEPGAEVRHGSRLEGPLYIGSDTKVLGGHLRGSVVGPHCRVHGEVSTTVWLGYANKSHDGFVGHSVVGAWVNLGAGTTTSNLKNTYGDIRLDIGSTRIETGRLNLGTLFGDHAKTAIGTMLPTGAVIGAGANVFGTATPKYVPPFAWGCETGEHMTEQGFLAVAERVMPRRGVTFDDAVRESLRATYRRLSR